MCTSTLCINETCHVCQTHACTQDDNTPIDRNLASLFISHKDIQRLLTHSQTHTVVNEWVVEGEKNASE